MLYFTTKSAIEYKMILGVVLEVSEQAYNESRIKKGRNEHEIVFVRHGQSEWNAPQFIFTVER